MSALTIINVSTGEVQKKEFNSIAGGQILLQHCSNDFIEGIIATVTGVAGKLAPVLPAEVTEAKVRINKAKAKKTGSCGAGAGCCKNRPSEAQVSAALTRLQAKEPIAEFDIEAAKDALTVALTDDVAFVEAVRQAVKENTDVNPSESLPSTKNILVALALFAHHGVKSTFKAGDALADYSLVTDAGREAVRRLAVDFSILQVASGRLAQIKYRVAEDFENLVIDVINQQEFAALLAVADNLQNQIESAA